MTTKYLLGSVAGGTSLIASETPIKGKLKSLVAGGGMTISDSNGLLTLSGGVTGQDYSSRLTDNTYLKVWNSRVAKYKGDTQDLKILQIGDSIQHGVQGSTIAFSQSTVLKNLLNNTYGMVAHDCAWMGSGDDGNSGAPRNTVDTRITKGSSWTNDNATYITLGGGTWTATTTTNALAFLPDTNLDTITIYYVRTPTSGIFSIDGNGLGSTNYDTSNASNAVGTATFTGSHPFNIKYVSGGRVDIIGVICSSSVFKTVAVINAGVGGSTSSGFVSTTEPWSPINMLSVINPDLTEFNYSTNDSTALTDLVTYRANMQSIITAAQAVGDAVAIVPPPSNPSYVPYTKSYELQETYNDVLRDVANDNLIPYLDIFAYYGTYESGDTLGYYYDTYVHLSKAGNAVIGALKANLYMGQVLGGINKLRHTMDIADVLKGIYYASSPFITRPAASSLVVGINTGNAHSITGAFNTILGDAFGAATSGFGFTVGGYQALNAAGGAGKQHSTAWGYQAGLVHTGNYATFIGSLAGSGFTTGDRITCLGRNTGAAASRTGSDVLLIGTGQNAVDTPTAGTSNYINIANIIAGNTQTHTAPGVGIVGVKSLLGTLKGANFNVTTDNTITLTHPISGGKYILTDILVTNASTNLTTAAGGVYTDTGKAGTTLVAAGQVYTALTAATKTLYLTLAAAATADTFTDTSIHLSLTTGQGSAATADVYVFGIPLG